MKKRHPNAVAEVRFRLLELATSVEVANLTTELSGRPPLPLRIGEHTIRREHDAPTMIHGPLQCVVGNQASLNE